MSTGINNHSTELIASMSLPECVPDVVRDPDALANLACFAIDSAAGRSETFVGIDFLKYEVQITYLESKSPIERLTIAQEIIGYLKLLISQPSQATQPTKMLS